MQALFLLFSSVLAGQTDWQPVPLGTRLDEFSLLDHRGKVRKFGDWEEERLLVVAFLGVDCPLARLYGRRLNDLEAEFRDRGVKVVGINSNQHDGLKAIRGYVERHELTFPVLKDGEARVADRLGAVRTPEVFLLDNERRVRYRGRIDDQYLVGLQRSKPTRRDLACAIEELLAGKKVSQPVTEATGCFIDRLPRGGGKGRITYNQHIAPIVQKHCMSCHRPGQIGPFPLTSYRETVARARTMVEVVAEGRMPPWSANPEHGRFANDPRLSEEQKQHLYQWVDAGCPEGDPADLPPPKFSEGWNIPEPDLVISMPEPFTVPAEGVIEYQYITVDPGFTEDKWVCAAEIRPGNRAVVHHCTVFLKPPGIDEVRAVGKLGSVCLAATAPGTPPLLLPDGMAKRVPAGSRLLFVLHYTPVGSVQTDRTSVGLVFADREKVRKEVGTHLLYDEDLRIPPHAANHRVEKSWKAPADIVLLAMFPHMHLRGKSFRYEAIHPDDTTEILLDVPRWDFNWQHRYVLAEPRRLPRDTLIRCVAIYDNSAGNLANPDPEAEVRAGTQTWDEMFNGYFEWALADEDMSRPEPVGVVLKRFLSTLARPIVLFSLATGLGLLLVLHRLRPRSQGSVGEKHAPAGEQGASAP